MGYQSQKLISPHAGNNKTRMFLESKYISTANTDTLTAAVGFRQRHTQKPLGGGDVGGILGMVNQTLCRLQVAPAPGSITSTEGWDERSGCDGSRLNLRRVILQNPQQKEKKSGLQVPGCDLSLRHNVALVSALCFQGGRAQRTPHL